MEVSILEADDPTRVSSNDIGTRIATAWRTVSTAVRGAVVGGLICCVVLSAWVPGSLATGVTLAVLVLAALVDVVEHRLPNALVGLAAVPVIVALLATRPADLVTDAALGAAVLGGPLLVTHLLSPAGIGFGDVKAGVVLGAAIGLVDAQVALLALLLALAVSAGWALIHRRATVALGPGLVAGALTALLAGQLVGLVGTTA